MSAPCLISLLRPELAELRAYVPEPGQFAVRLDANEAPPLLSERARARLAEVAAQTAWERYPDATAQALREAVAEQCAVTPEEVLVGVGSDELISLLMTALGVARTAAPVATVLTTTPTFVMYRLSARVRGMRVVEVPLDEQWDLPIASLLRGLELSQPNLVFIASPNNPTGNLMSRDLLRQVIEAARGALVVVDEAYVDYAASDQLELLRDYEHVVVLRTLSKIGFASLRIGWLLARPELINELNKARLPYNVNAPSQRLGTLVLTELRAELQKTIRYVVQERERLVRELDLMTGLEAAPSDANFLWLRTERPAGEVFDALASRGILVRSFHARGGRLGNQIRVTVGSRSENDAFLAALREVT